MSYTGWCVCVCVGGGVMGAESRSCEKGTEFYFYF